MKIAHDYQLWRLRLQCGVLLHFSLRYVGPHKKKTRTETITKTMSDTVSKQNASVPMGNQSVAQASPAKTSAMAIASLVCSIVSLFVIGIILGPIAIFLGVRAKNEISKRPNEVTGECMATSGIVIGCIGTILSIVVIILLFTS